MFGNEKKYWNAVKSHLAELLGKSEDDLTDAELVAATLEFAKTAAKSEGEKEGEEKKEPSSKKAQEPEKEADKADSESNSDTKALKSEITALAADLKDLREDYATLSEKVSKIEKLPSRQSTNGKRDMEETPKKGDYSEKQAPVFED